MCSAYPRRRRKFRRCYFFRISSLRSVDDTGWHSSIPGDGNRRDPGQVLLFGLGESSQCAFLPYRPLPFLAGIGAQIRPKWTLRLTRKLLIRANFPITLEKLGRQEINSPSRHQNFPFFE